MVVVGVAGLCAAGGVVAGAVLEFWESSAGARRNKQSSGDLRRKLMPTL
jgi:hypothetical protein